MCEFAGGTVPGMFTNSFFGNFVNFIFALSAVPMRLAGTVQCMSELMFRTVPAVLAKCCFVGIVARTAVTIDAIPVSRCASFFGHCVMCSAIGTGPGVLTGFGSRAALFALFTPPVMIATDRFFIPVDTFRTEPTFVGTNIPDNINTVMRLLARRANPIMQTACFIVQYRFAGRAPAVTVRTNGIKRMPRPATGAIPKVKAGFADGVRTLARRTIPLIVSIANCIDGIMAEAIGAEPVMFALFPRFKAFVTGLTEAVTAVGALRQRGCMFVCAFGAVPIMTAMNIGIVVRHAGFAKPVSVTGLLGRMPIGAIPTPPPVGTILSRCINTFATVFSAPAVLVCTGFRLQMTVLMTRAVPGMVANGFGT